MNELKPEDFAVNAGGGKKHVAGKALANQVPAMFIEALSAHMSMGARKYGFGNWTKGLKESQALESIRRHGRQLASGERIDSETGSSHYLAIAANAMMAWCLEQVGRLELDGKGYFIDQELKGVSNDDTSK